MEKTLTPGQARAHQMVDEIRDAIADVDEPERVMLLITGFAFRDFYQPGCRLTFRDVVRGGERYSWMTFDGGPEVEVVKTVTTDERLDGARWRLVKR